MPVLIVQIISGGNEHKWKCNVDGDLHKLTPLRSRASASGTLKSYRLVERAVTRTVWWVKNLKVSELFTSYRLQVFKAEINILLLNSLLDFTAYDRLRRSSRCPPFIVLLVLSLMTSIEF
jgi:hypothetical protein